jgi:hypothetical protein
MGFYFAAKIRYFVQQTVCASPAGLLAAETPFLETWKTGFCF